MDEIELKFQIPAGQSLAVARAVATTTARRVRLQAAYADTADRRLAAAGLALRLRREGQGRRQAWLQTLKGRGDGLMARPEHEVPVPGGASLPAFDASRHAGTPVGDRLAALLADGAPLEVLYRTDIRRTLRTVRSGGAAVELAHDRGHIEAGGRRLAVDEIEFELKAGPAEALLALAARWVARHGLWWDVRTKSERGFRLAEGLAQVPAARAAPSAVVAGQRGTQVLAAMLQGALAQVLPNAAELAGEAGAPEHLHQLRVGLRRLRGVLRDMQPLAAGLGAEAAAQGLALEQAWAAPFRVLGASRDADVHADELAPEIDAALAVAGLPPLHGDTGATGPHPPAPAPAPDPGAVLRSAEVQTLLLRSLRLAVAAAAVSDEAAPALSRDEAAALLKPLWKRVKRGSRDIVAADAESLHALRKRAKRLRYGLEALAPLLPPKRLKRVLAALKPALDRLGEINDLHSADQALAAHAEPSPSLWFARGLLAERHRQRLPLAQRALANVFSAPAPWR